MAAVDGCGLTTFLGYSYMYLHYGDARLFTSATASELMFGFLARLAFSLLKTCSCNTFYVDNNDNNNNNEKV